MNLTAEEIAAFESLQTAEEARALCDTIKARRGGMYPPDWWKEMKMTGRMDRVYARWGSDSNLHVSTYRPSRESGK